MRENNNNMQGVSIVDAFDVNDVNHIKEWDYLRNNSRLKNDSIFLECDFVMNWQTLIAYKLANAYVDFIMDIQE